MAQPSLTDSDGARTWTLFQQFEAIVNSSEDAIIGKTAAGVITSWNPAAERIYGYAAADIVGKPMTVLCPPDRVGEIREILPGSAGASAWHITRLCGSVRMAPPFPRR